MLILCMLLFAFGGMNVWGADATKSVSIGTYATSQSWTDQSKHTSIPIDDYVTASVSNGSNTGKYYSNDNTWRLYANESATLTISTTSGTISSVTITFTTKDNGTIKYGNSACTSGTAKSVSGSSASFSVGSSSGSKGKVFITSISVTYTPATPSYSIAASSNNNSWGTVSVDGTTITATPADCYQVASGTSGYNKISGTGTITHTGNSNTISVTPTSNCSIQVIFGKKIVNTYIDEIQDNGEFEDCSTSAPSLTDKSAATTGTCAHQHWHFVGWVTAANKANPTDANIIKAGETVAVNGTTYYAVWAKGSAGSSATVTFSPTSDGSSEITNSISSYVESSSGISSYSGTKVYEGAYGLKLGSSNNAGTVTCTLSSSITTKTITIDAKKYGSDTGTLSCKVNGNTTFGTTQSPSTSGGVLTFTNANAVTINSVSISTSSKRGYVKTITIGEAATYSDYITTCCTALAQVNGSANLSQWNAGVHIY